MKHRRLDSAQVFDVVIGTGLNQGEAFAIKSGKDSGNEVVGFKCGTCWAGNNDKGLPAHGSTILLLDPDTGFPGALVAASYLNGFRTAAANAVAVSFLARSDASVLGVIGADYPQQSIVIGEFQHACKGGLINSADEICALGLVTLGKSPGRNSDTEITVFDSSGIAIQDLMAAGAIFTAVEKMNQIQYIDF